MKSHKAPLNNQWHERASPITTTSKTQGLPYQSQAGRAYSSIGRTKGSGKPMSFFKNSERHSSGMHNIRCRIPKRANVSRHLEPLRFRGGLILNLDRWKPLTRREYIGQIRSAKVRFCVPAFWLGSGSLHSSTFPDMAPAKIEFRSQVNA